MIAAARQHRIRIAAGCAAARDSRDVRIRAHAGVIKAVGVGLRLRIEKLRVIADGRLVFRDLVVIRHPAVPTSVVRIASIADGRVINIYRREERGSENGCGQRRPGEWVDLDCWCAARRRKIGPYWLSSILEDEPY